MHGRRCYNGALDSLVKQGYSMKEPPSKKSRRARKVTLASLEAQGYMGEGVAATELSHRGRDGALDSLKAEGFTREEASYVHARRGYNRALDSLVVQGHLMEEAPSKKGRQCYRGIIASLEAMDLRGRGWHHRSSEVSA